MGVENTANPGGAYAHYSTAGIYAGSNYAIQAEYNSDSTRNNSSENLEKVFQVLDNSEANELFRVQAALIQQSSSHTFAVTLDSISGQIYASAQALTFQQMQAVE